MAGAPVPAALGREQRRLVAGDGGLRRERVEWLRARDARDRLHRERRDSARSKALDPVGIRQRREEADQNRAVSQRRDFVLRRRRDLDDEVRVERVVDEACAGVGIRLVEERRLVTGVPLDRDLEPLLRELRNRLGNERNTPFAGSSLPRNGDPHPRVSLTT